MRKYFSLDYYKRVMQVYKSYLKAENEPVQAITEDAKAYRKRMYKAIFGLFLLYALLYFLFYLFNYTLMETTNTAMKAAYQKKGVSLFYYYLNSYPFNVVYLLFAIVAACLYLCCTSYPLLQVLGIENRHFGKNSAILLHSSLYYIVSYFPLLIINSNFPVGADSSYYSYVFLGILWVLILGTGARYSGKFYANTCQELFAVNRNQAYVVWAAPQLFLLYLLYLAWN
ncbi:MAG: hypothetical protein AAF518_08135 [Spirochaetota bacterium]